MVIVNLAAFLCVMVLLAHMAKEKLVDILPVAVSILILLLYLLAFFNGLYLIDGISLLLLAVTGFYLLLINKEKGRQIIRALPAKLFHPGFLAVLFIMILVSVLVKDKVVTWWDDYNFWATDAKSLFYLNGFAKRYQNAAPEFGDYPPGIQLMKWYFLHFSPDTFREGLMFAGYYCLNIAFLAPLLRRLKGRNVLMGILGGVLLWLLPSVAEVFYFDGACADLTMAVVYGAFLVAVLDRAGHKEWFYYGRLALYLAVLVLTKNVGFMWAAFGLLFLYVYLWFTKSGSKKVILVTLAPVVTEGSWLLFCYSMRRVAKLTGTAVNMAVSGVALPDYTEELIGSFFTAFFTWPLHRWKTVVIDFTPAGLCAVILIVICLMGFYKVISKKMTVFLGVFMAGSAVVFYAINLISHLTIFSLETQYLEPYAMVSSIERYGAPFTIGSLYLLAFLLLEHGIRIPIRWQGKRMGRFIGQYGAYCVCLAFVLLSADHNSSYRGLVGYRENVAAELQTRNDIIGTHGEILLAKLQNDWQLKAGRILYLQDGQDMSWVGNTYLNYEAAPVSLMHGSINTEIMSEQEIAASLQILIADSHAQYLYVNPIAGDLGTTLNQYAGEEFSFETLYRIEETADSIQLIRIEDMGRP